MVIWSMTYRMFWDRSFGDKLWELAKQYDVPYESFGIRIQKRRFAGREDVLEEIMNDLREKGFPVFVQEENVLQEPDRVLVRAVELEELLKSTEEK